jgi:hypothetical protein
MSTTPRCAVCHVALRSPFTTAVLFHENVAVCNMAAYAPVVNHQTACITANPPREAWIAMPLTPSLYLNTSCGRP